MNIARSLSVIACAVSALPLSCASVAATAEFAHFFGLVSRVSSASIR